MECLAQIEAIKSSIKFAGVQSIRAMHRFIYEEEGDRRNRPRLREFAGFTFKENSDEYEKKMEYLKHNLKTGDLIATCLILKLDYSGTREELIKTLLNSFLDINSLNDDGNDGDDDEDENDEHEDENIDGGEYVGKDVHEKMVSPDLKQHTIQLTGFGGGEMRPLGYFEDMVIIDGNEFFTRIFVVPTSTMSEVVVIGQDLLCQAELRNNANGTTIHKTRPKPYLMKIDAENHMKVDVREDCSNIAREKKQERIECLEKYARELESKLNAALRNAKEAAEVQVQLLQMKSKEIGGLNKKVKNLESILEA